MDDFEGELSAWAIETDAEGRRRAVWGDGSYSYCIPAAA